MNSVRQPAVAGLFYPDNCQALAHDIDKLLAEAEQQLPSIPQQPKALIVPHAGYIYSGSTAAKAYAALSHYAQSIRRVVILGPAHRVWVKGIAIADVENFRTPLGDIPIDLQSQQSLLELPFVNIGDQAHWQEHCLEVQLPFLQRILEAFVLVPLVVGEASTSQMEEVLNLLWGDEETILIISSDLSHYLDYRTAQEVDKRTCRSIEALDHQAINSQQACGSVAVKGLLQIAQHKRMDVQTLGQCNSGDTAGDQSRVVGYGSWAFYQHHVH